MNWGLLEYSEALRRQHEAVERRLRGEVGDTFYFVEHPAVITRGRASLRQQMPVLPPPHVPVLNVERGGMDTYHGPGQIVVYPVVKLGKTSSVEAARGVVSLIRCLELSIVATLCGLGLKSASLVDKKTGVWVGGERKIASIGIAARHWVSFHGLSLNVNTGLEPWAWLSPCGFGAEVMTDLKTEMAESTVSLDQVRDLLWQELQNHWR